MGTIILGTYTPSLDPSDMTVIRPYKPTASKPTYSGVVYFGWPATLCGKQVDLTWNLMPVADFNALDVIYAADIPIVFDPADGTGKTYNVNILALDGKYMIRSRYRSEVKLSLLIMSEAT